MNYTIEERGNLIIAACKDFKSTNPYKIFQKVASQDFVRIHGPEHHVLDGACILTAYYAFPDFLLKYVQNSLILNQLGR